MTHAGCFVIPKILHGCWLGGGAQNALIRRCRERWNRILPEYEMREWTEAHAPVESPYCRAALATGYWARASNFIHLWALFREGGLYLDTDVEVLASFDALLDDECFLGFQSVERIPGWVNTAVLGARPNHPFLSRCTDLTLHDFETRGIFELSPRIATRVLIEMGMTAYEQQRVGDVTLYPSDYSYPYLWIEPYHPECITDRTLAVHHWAHSWKGT